MDGLHSCDWLEGVGRRPAVVRNDALNQHLEKGSLVRGTITRQAARKATEVSAATAITKEAIRIEINVELNSDDSTISADKWMYN